MIELITNNEIEIVNMIIRFKGLNEYVMNLCLEKYCQAVVHREQAPLAVL